MPAEVLDAQPEPPRSIPGVRMDIAGAVYFPQDCHLSPDRFMAALQRRARRKRASNFAWNTEVTGWRDEQPDRMRAPCDDGAARSTADEFVLCGGVMVAAASRASSASSCRCRPAKATASRCRTRASCRSICAILTEARVAVTPMGGALRFGGTMEIAGLNERINPAPRARHHQGRAALLPGLHAGGFRGHPAMARTAPVLAGRPALPRPHGRATPISASPPATP